MNFQRLTAAIYEAGFDAFAIMPAKPVTSMLPILREAQEKNRYPDFADPDISRRLDPRNLQKSARSIISLAVSYNTGSATATPPLHGLISRSACGLDYHRVLGERMDRVIAYLKKHCGATECTKAVDTSFLIDRALAVEAGLGYPGSNCAVYVPPFGSWVFLGEILVDVDRGLRSLYTGLPHKRPPCAGKDSSPTLHLLPNPNVGLHSAGAAREHRRQALGL